MNSVKCSFKYDNLKYIGYGKGIKWDIVNTTTNTILPEKLTYEEVMRIFVKAKNEKIIIHITAILNNKNDKEAITLIQSYYNDYNKTLQILNKYPRSVKYKILQLLNLIQINLPQVIWVNLK